MTPIEIEQFRFEFRQIVHQSSRIKDKTMFIRSLHVWDKDGSHKAAIIRHTDELKVMKSKLQQMLKGRSYEEWRETSKVLSRITNKMTTAHRSLVLSRLELGNLLFEL